MAGRLSHAPRAHAAAVVDRLAGRRSSSGRSSCLLLLAVASWPTAIATAGPWGLPRPAPASVPIAPTAPVAPEATAAPTPPAAAQSAPTPAAQNPQSASVPTPPGPLTPPVTAPAGASTPDAPGIAQPPAGVVAAPPGPPPAPPPPRPTLGVDPPAPPPLGAKDELPEAGYLPGYRRAKTLGLSPYVPMVGSIPGGVTPAFGAPTPSPNWTFRWNGFLSASLQASLNHRSQPLAGQNATVFHVPAQTLDEYASFVGTSTMPGTWAALNFELANKLVSANFSINTWNPSQPSTYYQVGTQYFINNAFVTFNAPPVAGIGVRASFGYFYNTYGSLSQFGLGMYQNSIIGSPRGVGGTVLAEYAINPSLSIIAEDGFIGNRNGKVPDGVVGNTGNGGTTRTPLFPASWVHHLHLGIIKKGSPLFRAQLHYMVNWAQDDRSQMATDNPTTRQIDESYIRDGSIRVYGIDANISHNIWGYLGAAAAYIKGQGDIHFGSLLTYGGDGVSLTDKWWGGPSHGTGTIAVAGFNYSVSLGKIVARPTPFNGDGPDLLINTGFVVAKSTTTFQPFDRTRHKYGLDVLYKFFSWMGAGIRGDRVVPTSQDSGETFHVIAPRLMFKSDWQSRETVTLVYAKWFYGPRSHPEGSSSMVATDGFTPDKIDDQLIALNVNMWW